MGKRSIAPRILSAHLKHFTKCEERTGIPVQQLLNEAHKNFITDCIPALNQRLARNERVS